jgi:hypothetical protein
MFIVALRFPDRPKRHSPAVEDKTPLSRQANGLMPKDWLFLQSVELDMGSGFSPLKSSLAQKIRFELTKRN